MENSNISFTDISVVIPAKNEGQSLVALLPKIKQQLPGAEIVVVNDGSSDNTLDVCRENRVIVVTHPYSMGNGAAIKSGARVATREILVTMDADGQHPAEEISRLLEKLNQGYDMVVGARDRGSQANIGRFTANYFYNRLASWIVGHRIADLTSGFRAVRMRKFKKFLYLLPNGFSYPTTITMSFFRAGYAVTYVPIRSPRREGKSHISPIKDGVRFLLIIFRIGSLYSPLKLFVPFSLSFFMTGLVYYIYSYLTIGRFTNMSALLISISVVIFLIGLVSEQITNLLYSRIDDEH